MYLADQTGDSPLMEGCDIPGTVTGGPPGSLFCLAPDWVYPASAVTLGAVGSYPTFSPLPPSELGGGLFSVTLAVSRGLNRESPRFHGESCPGVSGLSSLVKNHQSECVSP